MAQALFTLVAFQKLVSIYVLTKRGDYFLPKNVTNVISGWAFDNDGVMWGVGRNEDGDETGNF